MIDPPDPGKRALVEVSFAVEGFSDDVPLIRASPFRARKHLDRLGDLGRSQHGQRSSGHRPIKLHGNRTPLVRYETDSRRSESLLRCV